MNLNEKQLELLIRQKNVALATSGLNNQPRVIFVEVNKAENDTIVITDNQMTTTANNIKENPKVALLAFEQDYSYCLKITGSASYEIQGVNFDFVKSLKTNQNYSPKAAIVIKISDIKET